MERKDEQMNLLIELQQREQDVLEEKTKKVRVIRLEKSMGREVVQSQLFERSERARLQTRSAR